MAYYAGVAIAANVINQNMRQRRNNVYRTGIASLEDTEVALRINSAEIDTLVDEYHLWRRAQFGINASHKLQPIVCANGFIPRLSGSRWLFPSMRTNRRRCQNDPDAACERGGKLFFV